MEYLQLEDLIFINQFNQKIVSLERIMEWFSALDEENKRGCLKDIWFLIYQAHPQENELEQAVEQAYNGKKYTAAVLLISNKYPFSQRGYYISMLPNNELDKAFKLFITLLSIADNRRRESENPAECTHWWHKDLSDKEYVNWIRYNLRQ